MLGFLASVRYTDKKAASRQLIEQKRFALPTGQEITDRIIEVLASIRAVNNAELREEIKANGADTFELTSHEVVAVLVELEPLTGLDPEDPNVLKGCNAQSLENLVDRCHQKEND